MKWLFLALAIAGCGPRATAVRVREYSPLMRRYQEMRATCDPDEGTASVKKTGCPVCGF